MKYLKTYTTYTTGTLGGRDDGYPYTAKQTFDNMEELAKAHGTKRDEKYFIIKEVEQEAFLEEIYKIKEEIAKKKEEEERERKMKQLRQLQKELGIEPKE
jgi:hypothetical protein